MNDKRTERPGRKRVFQGVNCHDGRLCPSDWAVKLPFRFDGWLAQ
jgi:hypothetical protein